MGRPPAGETSALVFDFSSVAGFRLQRVGMIMRAVVLLRWAAIMWLGGLAAVSQAEDWPQFRGPNGSGVSSSKSLPLEFSAEQKVVWQATLGDGIGCPIVASGRVFNTAMTGSERFTVFCHDAASGELLWHQEMETGPLPRITPPNSHASSTPASDGRRVYVYFSTLGLMAFDAASGEKRWTYELPRPAFLMDWGAGSSPIVYQDKVFFCMDDDLTPYVLALNAGDGQLCWRTPRPDMLAGYALPVMCQADGRTDLVVAGTGKLKGYDPQTGRELWTCNTLLRTIMTSPVVHDGVIYVAVQSYGDSARTVKFALLEWLDTNQDGKLSKPETPKEFWERFDRSDRNQDELLDDIELDTAFQSEDNRAGGGNTIQAVRGGGSGDVTGTHLLWNLDNKSPSNLSSPLVVSNRLLVVKAGGICSCFDARSGETVWERTRIRNFGDYYASPIAADGKIYIAGRNGFVVVIEDAPELKVLAKNDMRQEILATPAIADGRLFIRTREKIYCVAE
jgi:outer membrane protein assembly factor BamB